MKLTHMKQTHEKHTF